MADAVRRNGVVVRRLPAGGGDCIVKIYGHRPRNLRDYRQQLLRLLGKPMPIDHRPPEVRCKDERAFLEAWTSRGYRAPRVLPCPPEYAESAALCIEYFPGDSVRARLRAVGSEPGPVCEALFEEMRARHLEAIESQEQRLVHIDANTSNILVHDDGYARIDFDAALCIEPVHRTAAREVKTLALGVLNDVRPGDYAAVIDALVTHYGLEQVLRQVIRMGGGPWFRDLQRWGHRRFRPARRHVAVTKFELADWLRERRGR